MSEPTSFSSIILGSTLLEATGRNLYLNNKLIDYSIGGLKSSKNYQGYNSPDGINVASFGSTNLLLFDNGNENYGYGDPFITQGYKSIDWGKRYLYTENDNDKALSWSVDTDEPQTNCSLLNIYGEATLKWRDYGLIGSDAYSSVNWNIRKLYPSGFSQYGVLDWSINSGIQIACPTGLNNTPFKPVDNSYFSFSLDELNNKMSLIVKYSNGTIKSGSINLS